MAGYAKKTLSLFLLASLCQHAAAAARVVQLVAGRRLCTVTAQSVCNHYFMMQLAHWICV
jgi:hypothetical protein